ncbi:class A beta-lactamase [Variovorax sp. OV329]|uniref:class A beta-lactamase n=1 Tax=Variovorax sp. OV329 TaxID=1882825 RepID=UPI001587B524|nr:class A beta-lactamase [Variovorax sp. OV329]
MKNNRPAFDTPMLSRRGLLLTAMCSASAAWATDVSARRAGTEAQAAAALAEIERRSGGSLGLHAMDTGSGRTLSHRGEERFAMASTFKLLLAAAVLHRNDQAAGVLDERLPVRKTDLIAHSPITSKHLQAGFITAREACEATVQVSDNAAANLLLPLVGGPEGLTTFVRERCGDGVTRLDRTEPTLNTNLPGDLRDTTTPAAMARTTARLLTGDVLSGPSRTQLKSWLEGASTGMARLRAGLPKDWRTGDKTGTGANGAANDVAVTWAPGRAPIVLAVYLNGSTQPPAVLDATHAQAAAVVAAFFTGPKG